MNQCANPDPGAGLYDPCHEHDGCGVGFVAHVKGKKSHALIEQGLLILEHLEHRGAVGADPLMGDGAGVLIQIPHALFRAAMVRHGVTLPDPGEYGAGMLFLPRDATARQACEQALERCALAHGLQVLGWRDVPTDRTMPMSPIVRAHEPVIRQVFIGCGRAHVQTDALERRLYGLRKRWDHAIRALEHVPAGTYCMVSLSARTIVYKGLLLAEQVGQYYPDLRDPRAASALVLVHQRFSTNTFPAWELAHPYRMIAHNGEINTIRGNINALNACHGTATAALPGGDLDALWPIIHAGQSDTASFDNCLELLVMAGYPLAQAIMMMIPEAWEHDVHMAATRRDFYAYHAALMAPWDGPAALVFTDGRQVGATLDRNGLRPARYVVTGDDRVILASEAGVLAIPEKNIVHKWRLQPGRMLLIDTEAGRIIGDDEIKDQMASARPYAQWLARTRIRLRDLPSDDGEPRPATDTGKPRPATDKGAFLLRRQQAFGYTREDLKFQLLPMAQSGAEALGSMGDDRPLAVLSNQHRSLYDYFRQQFAQVTNPAIDPIRERLVMSLATLIGPRPGLLERNPAHLPALLEAPQPVLDEADMAALRCLGRAVPDRLRSHVLDITCEAQQDASGMAARLDTLCTDAEEALRQGGNILILSDRSASRERVAIPALLATSVVHQHLVRQGLRTRTGLVVETGSAREVHHFAVLAGYGADAIHPYLALETVRHEHAASAGTPGGQQAVENYVHAIGKGLLKVMSKMGISTYLSYMGSQPFEAVGLADDLVERCFAGTASTIQGIGLKELLEEALWLHRSAWRGDPVLADSLADGGDHAWRERGEAHMWTPDTIAHLQHAVRGRDARTYAQYARLVNEQSTRLMTLRGLFRLRLGPSGAVPLDEVEPAAEIVKRFVTGAMSLGSISTEAHTTLAIAMNRLGGKSNTGEGGEDPARYRAEMAGGHIQAGDTLSGLLPQAGIVRDQVLQEGDSLRSRIKQVASGRFGVTAAYLVSADQIQIKIAQGAKPGEGGQLPGHKVTPYIADLRFSVPGVGLISPPPHHDIYSIEDLAQLIHDLKCVNPAASISVKLVSEVGVGTIAAGVAKAKADHVVISGHDGGTGASPWSSILRAGSPWELGLAETQQTLVRNGLRGRIRIQADGQMKTGHDVVIAALLGADEMGFATAPLVAMGCIQMRKGQTNTCPTGIATQDPELRRRFVGLPEHVMAYFLFVAQEVREIMAQCGFRRFDDMVGRADRLDMRAGIDHWKARGLDCTRIFHRPPVAGDVAIRHVDRQDHALDKALDHVILAQARQAIDTGQAVCLALDVCNADRSVGALLSGEIARQHGEAGLPEDTIRIHLTGTGGQSFGAFLAAGITLDLEGQANDYVGKGLSGGRIIVRQPDGFRGWGPEQIIAGNTLLYGATRGDAWFNGVAGERFAVRNSGAVAVVEGVGDHGCEYMTGGTIVVLGETGRNFAAGMSGGVAYVFDPHGRFPARCNPDMVALEPVCRQVGRDAPETDDERTLKALIEAHRRHTGSRQAARILADWRASRPHFIKVVPHEYRRALAQLRGTVPAADACRPIQVA